MNPCGCLCSLEVPGRDRTSGRASPGARVRNKRWSPVRTPCYRLDPRETGVVPIFLGSLVDIGGSLTPRPTRNVLKKSSTHAIDPYSLSGSADLRHFTYEGDTGEQVVLNLSTRRTEGRPSYTGVLGSSRGYDRPSDMSRSVSSQTKPPGQ